MKHTEKGTCPHCGNRKVMRIRRRAWMRHIPFSELYDCPQCRGEHLKVLSIFKFKLYRGYSRLVNIAQNQ